MNPAKTELLWAGSKHISMLGSQAPALQLGSYTVTAIVTMFGCSELRSRLTRVSRSMSPRRVQSASIGFVNFVVSGSHWIHWMMDQRQLSCMLLLRLASTIKMQSMQGRRRRLPTSCNECSMLPPVWSVTE